MDKPPRPFNFQAALTFLRWVNKRQHPGLSCVRAFKDAANGGRVPVDALFYKNEEPWANKVTQFLQRCEAKHLHVYYSVSSFSREKAKAVFALPGRLAYVDADRVSLPPAGPDPTVIVQTSPGNFQFLYELDREVPRDELEQINSYLIRLVGGDRGGQSAAKLFRLPGTRNFKPERPNTPLVTVLGAL